MFPGSDLIGDDFAEFPRIPIDNDGRRQIQAGNAVLLPFGRAITDFAAPVEVDCAFQRVMGLTLVQADLSPALQLYVAQPVQHEDRAFEAARRRLA